MMARRKSAANATLPTTLRRRTAGTGSGSRRWYRPIPRCSKVCLVVAAKSFRPHGHPANAEECQKRFLKAVPDPRAGRGTASACSCCRYANKRRTRTDANQEKRISKDCSTEDDQETPCV